jgi:lipid II:glycine glycyltransferase (peptidoglycan interpeptide bridge formation enzyme)
MRILEQNLVERHGVKPVHNVDEIKLLASRFPNNIKLYASFKDEVMLAGIIIYESHNVAHIQYAANSTEGLKLGAQDIVEEYLINDRYKDKRYYDFGISTENQGRILNPGLIKFKEDFGASAVVYDVYQIVL